MSSNNKLNNPTYTNIKYKEDIAHFIIYFEDELATIAGNKQFKSLLEGEERPERSESNDLREVDRSVNDIKNFDRKNGIFLEVMSDMTTGTPAASKIKKHNQASKPFLALTELRNTIFKRVAMPPHKAVSNYLDNKHVIEEGATLYDDLESAIDVIDRAASTLSKLPDEYKYDYTTFDKASFLRQMLSKLPRFHSIFSASQVTTSKYRKMQKQIRKAIASHSKKKIN